MLTASRPRTIALMLFALAVVGWSTNSALAQSRRGAASDAGGRGADPGSDEDGPKGGKGGKGKSRDGGGPAVGGLSSGGAAGAGIDDEGPKARGKGGKGRRGDDDDAPAAGKKFQGANIGGSEETPGEKGGDGKEGQSSTADEIPWKSSLQDAIKEASSANKPILVDFFATWCGPCKQLDATTFKDRELIAFVMKNFVPVKVDVDKNKSQSKEYKIEAMPTTMVLRPDGKSVGQFVGYRDAKSYRTELDKILKDVGDLASASAKAKKLLEDANGNANAGKYAVAIGQLRTIVEKYRDSEEGKKAAEKLKDIEEMAVAKLKGLQDAAKKSNYAEMAKLATELQDVYAGTNAAGEARTIQNSLAGNKDAQKQIRLAQAKQSLDQAQVDLKAGKYAIVFDRLKNVQRDYQDQPRFAEEAKWLLERLQGNPVIVRKARDEVAAGQCKIWLSHARSWKGNKNMPRAKEYYQKVIETFPGTTFAETAERELQRGG